MKSTLKSLFDAKDLQQLEHFHENIIITPLKLTNQVDKLRFGKKFRYLNTKKRINTTKTQLLEGNAIDKLETTTPYYVTAKNKYLGRIIGLVFQIIKQADGKIDFKIIRKTFDKPVQRQFTRPKEKKTDYITNQVKFNQIKKQRKNSLSINEKR